MAERARRVNLPSPPLSTLATRWRPLKVCYSGAVARMEFRACGLRRLTHWAFAAFLATESVAHGNGAFPDTIQIFVAPERGDEFVLTTNFGLVMSRDGGASWQWTCEHGDGLGVGRYEAARAPSPRIWGLSDLGLAFTDDIGCQWTSAVPDGRVAPYDLFADPTDPLRLLILVAGGNGSETSIYESTNAGATFGRQLYKAAARETLTTVESARSDPRVIYATLLPARNPGHPVLLHSGDGGSTWTALDSGPVVDAEDLRIVAVDPTDARTVFFRVVRAEHEELAVTRNGGATFTLPLAVPGKLTAFVQLADGTLLAGAANGNDGAVYRSVDRGATFTEISRAVHPRALAERAGKVYVAADDIQDKFALGVSKDRGQTWQRVMGFADVRGINSCGNLTALCRPSCRAQVANGVFGEAACRGPLMDAGVTPVVPPGTEGGCGCRVYNREPRGFSLQLLMVLALLRRRSTKMTRRRGRGPQWTVQRLVACITHFSPFGK